MNYEKWNQIDLFIGLEEENPLQKYDYYFKKIDFSKCNYTFIIPEQLSDLFSSFYSKILKDSFIFFPKDFQQAKELLNDYEKESGNKENWILIAPCMELEKNIKIFHENKDIICFIGYCPIFNHEHDILSLIRFSKYYGIVNSYKQLIETLFKLSNLFYYRKKQKYILNNNDDAIIELKYDSKFLIDIKEEKLKEPVINLKLKKFFRFKMENDQCYFTFIKSLNFLDKCFKEKNNNLLCNIAEKLENLIIKELNIFSGLFASDKFLCSIFFKELHILYLYFSNYPYLYGVLTDEDINQILSKFKPYMDKSKLMFFLSSAFTTLLNYTGNLAMKLDKDQSILEEKEHLKIFHTSLIQFICSCEQLYEKLDIEKFSKYYQIKNFFRDIDFCLYLFMLNIVVALNAFPLSSEICQNIKKEKRYINYRYYTLHLIKDNITPDNEQQKIFNNAIKYNDTIVIGDKNFLDLINKMNLPCKNKYYINKKEILSFFEKPKKIDNKYKVCKYFIIMNEKDGIEYLETFTYIANENALDLVLIIYIQNKKIKIDKKILQASLIPIILTYCEKDILNYYNDHFDRLREMNIKYFDRNEFLNEAYGTSYKLPKFPKIDETKIIKEEDNGWDMKRNLDLNIFDLIKIENVFGCFRTDIFERNMYKVYKENNCLDLFIKYYGNYFGSGFIVEQGGSNITFLKNILYAYTLEESNGKSFYSLMNNDLRSGDSEKICRYLPMIRMIYDLINEDYLKSFSGDVYRATYFKKELIDEIKPGVKMFNSSFWSSSKKLSVAKKFLFQYKKNILLHTKIKKGNNIDIHLERLSQYPHEEEILFLPYCYFEIKSFKKVKENNFEYYDLELIYCEEENSRNKLENIQTHEFINY